jgi:hypothetical protein
MVTPATFRSMFSEFANPDSFSDLAITNWTNVALNLLDATRWDVMLDYGTMLYVAHHLTLARRDALAAQVGGVPGEVKGVVTAKQIDKVSASYDSRSVTLENAGSYNLTRYGVELYQLIGQFGAGGMQIQGGFPYDIWGEAWGGGYFGPTQ